MSRVSPQVLLLPQGLPVALPLYLLEAKHFTSQASKADDSSSAKVQVVQQEVLAPSKGKSSSPVSKPAVTALSTPYLA